MTDDAVTDHPDVDLQSVQVAYTVEGAETDDLALKIASLLQYVKIIMDENNDLASRRRALSSVSIAIQPQHISADVKQLFVERVAEQHVVDSVVRLIELGGVDAASDACDFLGDLSFNSDLGSRIVFKESSRIFNCFRHAFQLASSHELVRSFVSLCANLVATSPEGHFQLIPLIEPVILPIIRDPNTSDRLLSSAILLLANLSLTVGDELRELQVADALVALVLDQGISVLRKSVAESVVIYLLGRQPCDEIDQLMALGLVQEYCVPILQCALEDKAFRGMYPHLVYSARLFQVLASSRTYATALTANERVVPLLLYAARQSSKQARLGSDCEGRRLALETLASLVSFDLWPHRGNSMSQAFVETELPLLLDDERPGIRAASVKIWAALHAGEIQLLLRIGQTMEVDGHLPGDLWQAALTFLFPFLVEAQNSERKLQL